MIRKFFDGDVEIGQPDTKGLRECRFQGELIGMIKSLEDGRQQVMVKKGKPSPRPFSTITEAAGIILAAYINFQRDPEELQRPLL